MDMTENHNNMLEVQGEEFSQDKDKNDKEMEIIKISCKEDSFKIQSQNSRMRGQVTLTDFIVQHFLLYSIFFLEF